ncbi:hypothetical protein BSL78_00440 [Apostichopus japonicus]|uniref:Protein kinase domain-containing protein n=1 Tax=Stichopus japonicus TaxID=307972 RepID=A0A2G8LQV9_STIJA|nr:hypothetical protein BSL78_00440 [Apostichopus japonicus]
MLSSQILELQLSVKVAWVGPNLPYVVKRLSDLHQPVLFFTLTPSDLLQYQSFTRISFPTCPTPELVEGDIQLGGCDFPWHPVTKIAWSVVEMNAPPLAAFIQNICIDDGDIEDIFSSYAHSKLDMEEFTCQWLQENHEIWLDWIPAGSLAVRRKVFLPGLFPTIDSADELYDISRGASMAVQALNKHTEILPQVELSLLPYSTQCETDQTLDIYSGIMQNYTKPLAGKYNSTLSFLGPGCSSACENLSGVSKYFNQVIVSYFADSKSLAAKDRHPYLFRVFPDIQQIGFAKEKLFRYFEWTEFALISESDAPEMDDQSSVEDHLMISGIQCALCGTISHENVEETITAIKNAKPEVVIAYTSEELAKKITCEAFKQGLILDNGFMWIFPSWYNEDWWDLDKQNLTGAIGCSTSDMKTALSGGVTLTRVNLAEPDQVIAGGSTMSSWFDDFYELSGSNKSFVPLAAYAYDAVFTFAFALEKLFNEDATHLDSLQSDKTTNLFVEYLRNTSFVGATGPVDFINQDRRSPVTIMVNFFDSDPYQVVLGQYIPTPGTLDGGELYIDKSVADRMKRDFDFLTGETEVKTCAVERVREMLGSSCATAIVALCLLFTLILLVMTLSLGFLFKKKYDKKVKKAELRMKKLGILNLGIDSLSTLDKWEMAERCDLEPKTHFKLLARYGVEREAGPRDNYTIGSPYEVFTSPVLDFLSEAEMMKRFDHKNIIRLRGVCTQGEPLYAVMDFMLYGDLKTFLLARRHLVGQHSDEAEVLLPHRLTAMVHDIASGLDYLAKSKYVHRDLACRNCLVNSCYSVMISDFGMTRALYDSNYYRLNKQGRLPVRWMAPESVSEGLFTTMSDIWSLGVVIYEVVTFGGFPYPEMSNAAVLEYIREGNSMSPPETCPQMLSSLMLQCWVTEAYVRPTAEDIMILLAENQEMIEPCISVPHESMSVDGLSSGNFSRDSPAVTVSEVGTLISALSPAR